MVTTATFAVLGPLYVMNNGQRLPQAGRRQRALLAALLVRARQPVGLPGIVEALWGERPPASAVANVHTHVSRLRRDLAGIGLPDRLVTDSGGYRLRVDCDELDSTLFQTSAEEARTALASGDAVKAVAVWEEAWSRWRGEPLEDVPRCGWLEGEVVRLEEMAATAREDFADARLAAGQFGTAITELSALVRRSPLREGLWRRLMLAQQRAGRRAEALQTYHALRAVLVEALGVEPCDEIQRLHQEVLQGTTAAPRVVRPMQLPPDAEDLVGRAAETAELVRMLTGAGQRRTNVVAAITGKAGVGKTALAVRVAHEVGAEFGGGQLYVRLGGTSPSPRDPAAVLAELLIALGVHPHAVPDDLDAQAALYRSQLASRKVLVVLDDAAGMAQVRPLLPGSAGSAVLITSRGQLVETAGAHTVHLDVLCGRDAVRLLASIAGHDRMAAEPRAAAEVARYCGNLPLALRIAGSRLARRTHWKVGRLADRLACEGTRLNELRIDDLEARASLALSYQALTGDQQRAFRLLSLLDVPDFPGWVAGPLLELAVPDAEEVVDSLADAHLLELAAPGRYRFHELLRVFGRERAQDQDTTVERTAALRRAFGAWLDVAVRAEADLPCRFLKTRLPDRGAVPGLPVGDPLSFLEAERDALVAVASQAVSLGMTTLGCDVAGVLTTLFDLRGHYDLWRRTHSFALAAAERAGERRHRAVLSQGLGALAFYRDHFHEASVRFVAAQRLFADAGDAHGRAYADLGVGSVHMFHGRHDEAATELTRALAVFRECEDACGEAFSLQGLGVVHRNQGRLGDAEAFLNGSLAIFAALGCGYGRACTLFSMGLHHNARGDLEATERALMESVELFGAASCPRDEALALHVLAAVCAQQGDADRAAELMARSQATFRPADESAGKAETLYSLGWVAHRTGRVDDAAACFGEAWRLFELLDMPMHQERTVKALTRLGLTAPGRVP
ncbi:AfsR/SARP family transcriptional regulator [Lentzea sp.]|uniref:AfsR/SARP family transcriptional regulator n=1 Tax=Lentzea sp. TaxID=56099 RepID=UPI002BE24C56|nr:BTAD domain-containing putative transcriptional regulator [Lentzea sp.]HUQ59438.1 BTAD domain-containing putative transcriptional regulator [Lentzea sp.]